MTRTAAIEHTAVLRHDDNTQTWRAGAWQASTNYTRTVETLADELASNGWVEVHAYVAFPNGKSQGMRVDRAFLAEIGATGYGHMLALTDKRKD